MFCPGETTLDAGEGDISSSNYGGENASDSVGSLDWNAGITNGVIVYSLCTDGRLDAFDLCLMKQLLKETPHN